MCFQQFFWAWRIRFSMNVVRQCITLRKLAHEEACSANFVQTCAASHERSACLQLCFNLWCGTDAVDGYDPALMMDGSPEFYDEMYNGGVGAERYAHPSVAARWISYLYYLTMEVWYCVLVVFVFCLALPLFVRVLIMCKLQFIFLCSGTVKVILTTDRKHRLVTTWTTASLPTTTVDRGTIMISYTPSSVPTDIPITTATGIGRTSTNVVRLKWRLAESSVRLWVALHCCQL